MILYSILNKTPVVSSRLHVEGTHYPLGVFIAKGPGFSRTTDAGTFSICDVAPVLLHCLELPVPLDLEGIVPEGVFEGSYLREMPVVPGPPTLPSASYASKTAYATPEEEEKVIINQMRALGYIE